MMRKKYAMIFKKKRGDRKEWEEEEEGKGEELFPHPQHTESMESLNRKDLTISVPLLLKHTSMFPSGDEWIKSTRLR